MKRDGSEGNGRMGRESKRTVGREGYDRMCTEGEGIVTVWIQSDGNKKGKW